jgi:hypothetical protein
LFDRTRRHRVIQVKIDAFGESRVHQQSAA